MNCQCRTPEKDGSIKHSGKIVTFKSKLVNGDVEEVTVCWHHRKWYSGWKAAR